MALLKERPLKSITVTELAELADVNRATFYVHFQDVYDMFDQVKEEFCNICRELVDAHGEELAATRTVRSSRTFSATSKRTKTRSPSCSATTPTGPSWETSST